MSDLANNVRKTVDEALTELEQVADEVRLRLHLGGMDAKDAWRKLEPQIEHARQHARDASDASSNTIHDVLDSLKKFKSSLLGEEQTNPEIQKGHSSSDKAAG
jgi:hypothetical protein